MARLKEVLLSLIANDAPLGLQWLDHALKRKWADHRACHIGCDCLLIYQAEGQAINFVPTGTHAHLIGA
jgi:mRNA interferase YafQ